MGGYWTAGTDQGASSVPLCQAGAGGAMWSCKGQRAATACTSMHAGAPGIDSINW